MSATISAKRPCSVHLSVCDNVLNICGVTTPSNTQNNIIGVTEHGSGEDTINNVLID